MTRAISIAASIVVLMLIATSNASAQSGNVGLGYSFLHEFGSTSLGTTGVSYGLGWLASFATAPRSSLSWTTEIGGHYRQPAGVSQRLHAFLGGVRFVRARSAVTPFAQALIGVEHYSEQGFSQSALAIQPGGGVDVHLMGRVAARGQADLRWSHTSDGTLTEFRAGAGIVIRVGRK